MAELEIHQQPELFLGNVEALGANGSDAVQQEKPISHLDEWFWLRFLNT